MQTGKFPRVQLAALPTPLEPLKRFTKALGGPKIYIKRDDLTAIAFGGSKARVLEYWMGYLLQKGVDTAVFSGGRAGTQSNWCRMASSAARKVGIDPIAVLRGTRPDVYDGNVLLDELMGTDIRFMNIKPEETHDAMQVFLNELKDKGKNPEIIDDEELPGLVGYADLVSELLRQANDMGVHIDATVNACGSGGTYAAITAGAKALNTGIQTIGISCGESKEFIAENSVRIGNEVLEALGVKMSLKAEDMNVYDDWVGEGYGIMHETTMEAMQLLARTEGIIVGPVYTGKTLAGLVGLIRQGYFSKDDTVVFIHTGGTPALFPHKDEIMTLIQ